MHISAETKKDVVTYCGQGLEEVGDCLVGEAQLSGVERACTFALLQRCAAALLEGEPAAALEWAERRAPDLLHSPLPFTLHRMQALKVTVLLLTQLNVAYAGAQDTQPTAYTTPQYRIYLNENCKWFWSWSRNV